MSDNMNKGSLIEAVQKALGIECSKAHAERAVESVLESISLALKSGQNVQLTGFGTFTVKERGAREYRNPKTGEPVLKPGSKVVAFKAGSGLKTVVNDDEAKTA
jgi:DNA-binding protein HU-beta